MMQFQRSNTKSEFGRRFALLLAAGLCASAVTPAHAQLDHHVDAKLIASQTSVQPGGTITLGVLLTMDEGWHVYWKNPGDSGEATKVRWRLPDGFEASPLQWPAPSRFELVGLVGFITYGYEGQVLLTSQVKVPPSLSATSVKLTADVNWLACELSCIKGQASVEIELPVSDGPAVADERWQTIVEQTKRTTPVKAPDNRVSSERHGDEISIQVSDAGDTIAAGHSKPTFYAADRDVFDYAASESVERVGDAWRLRLKLFEDAPSVERVRGILVWPSDDAQQPAEVWAVDVPIGQMQAAPAAAVGGSMIIAMLFALIGGVLLNLMPCVFPVLSIKALGFVQQSGQNRRQVAAHGGAFAAGVLVSFWVLAGLLIALRAGGEQLGWGFQLQHPVFVAFMTLLIFAVGLNLAGVFEFGIGLMTAAGNSAVRLESPGLAGSFFTGVLATVIATPCTAPFMGPALGYALTVSATEALIVFTTLGVGMAGPYVVLSMFPAWLRWLPRPGAWMESFKQLMAFPMFAAAVWLAWTYGQLSGGTNGMLLILGAMLILAAGCWVLGRWAGPTRKPAVRRVGRIVSLLLIMAALAAPVWGGGWLTGNADGKIEWQPYNPELLAQLRGEQRPVFVDFTADWCITCKFNEGTALANDKVAAAFEAHEIAMLRANWTAKDEMIAKALAEFGRAGVPLYLMYSRDPAAEPQVLPTLLTASTVLEAIEKALGPLPGDPADQAFRR